MRARLSGDFGRTEINNLKKETFLEAERIVTF